MDRVRVEPRALVVAGYLLGSVLLAELFVR
jgi:hypothetical protein